MTDEEARQSIIDRHGHKAGWLAKRLIEVYERHRMKGSDISEALKQTDQCYLASIGAAAYDTDTDSYRYAAGKAAGGAG